MPTTFTYLEAVNEVLGEALGEQELTTATWANASQNQARVKRIIKSCLRDMNSSLPDEHTQAMTELVVPPIFNTGLVTDITGDTVTLSGVDLTAAFSSTYTPESCLFSLDGGDQWQRVRSVLGATSLQLFNSWAPEDVSSADGMGYRIFQWRHALPADFRDVMDVKKVFRGVDADPMGLTEFLSRVTAHGFFDSWADIQFWAIGSDVSLDQMGNPAIANVGGPYLYLAPAITEKRVYQFLYQRSFVAPSAAGDVIDLPDALFSQLIYRASAMARMSIADDPQGAGIYDRQAREQKKEAEERQPSQVDTPKIRPNMSIYRGFYRRGRRRTGGNRMIVDE